MTRTVKNKLLAICFIAILCISCSQINQVFAATAKGQVTIVGTTDICKDHISHFDHTITGTRDYQKLSGTNQNDLIIGFKNTWMDGKNGDDCLKGGNGENVIIGGNGNDVILGGTGSNVIFTGNGNNIVKGGAANDIIFFGNGHNTIDGGHGKNYCIGNPKNSIVVNCILVSHDNKLVIHDARIILSDKLTSDENDHHITPSWTKKTLDWWEHDEISDNDLISGLRYLLDI